MFYGGKGADPSQLPSVLLSPQGVHTPCLGWVECFKDGIGVEAGGGR